MGEIMWGSECETPDGLGLRFGGEDQKADDGVAHTQIKVDGQWRPIVEELSSANPLQKARDDALALRNRVRDAAAAARYLFFEGKTADSDAKPMIAAIGVISKDVQSLAEKMGPTLYGRTTPYVAAQCKLARAAVEESGKRLDTACAAMAGGLSGDANKTLLAAQVALEQAAALLDCEPGPRALSPIVYDARSKQFVVFGGDHLETHAAVQLDGRGVVVAHLERHAVPAAQARLLDRFLHELACNAAPTKGGPDGHVADAPLRREAVGQVEARVADDLAV
jgi:hypothetical protein